MAPVVVIRLPHSEQNGTHGPRRVIRTRRIGERGTYSLAIVGLMLLVFVPTSLHAATITGYDIYRQCTAVGDNEDAASDRLSCAAYLAGYLDGAFQVSRLNRLSPAPIRACPGDIAVGQYLLVFKRWAEQHPEWLSRSAPDTLAAALVEAFPCSAK
jgi:hypothetical protein